jgi:hypothetical protein
MKGNKNIFSVISQMAFCRVRTGNVQNEHILFFWFQKERTLSKKPLMGYVNAMEE